jgi:glycolate oxidase
MTLTRQWLERARSVVGDDGVLVEAADTEPYARDEFATDDFALRPPAVVRPSTEEQVAAIVRLCSESGVPVTARGGGTGLAAACVPSPGGIVLSLERLNRVIEGSAADATLTVEAGVQLGAVYREAEKLGLSFPPHPGDESAHIGGAVATNAGGSRAVKYGTIRNFVRGLRVVLASGDVVDLGGSFMKSSTGYNLAALMIGSEGTLGIITRVTLSLLPPPGSIQTLVAPFATVEEAIEAAPGILRAGIIPFAVEFVEHSVIRSAERMLDRRWPAQKGTASLMVILEDASDEAVLQRAEKIALLLEESGATDVLVAEHKEQQAQILEMRSLLYEALRPGTAELFDISVPRGQIAGHVRFVHDLEGRLGMQLPTYGHAADGNVHTHTLRRRLEDGAFGEEVPDWHARSELVRRELYADAISRRGVISGEHGIGLAKRAFIEGNLGAPALAAMRAIKAALDPKGILNPGKILP